MPLSRSRDYLSIGEVIDALREDFPDVSISKVRFLETEKLISPERTPSGYRKFYEADVARLRYVLGLQRDQFMPLKVIRERLAEADDADAAYPSTEDSAAPVARVRKAPGSEPVVTALHMTRAELLGAAELSEDQMSGLEDFGLVRGNGDGVYDENDLLAATSARRFFDFGVEPRHLRMYRQIAEREAAFFEQIVSPVALRRDPEGKREASRSVREMLTLARGLRESQLREVLRDHLVP